MPAEQVDFELARNFRYLALEASAQLARSSCFGVRHTSCQHEID
jgi:hypothetical protein